MRLFAAVFCILFLLASPVRAEEPAPTVWFSPDKDTPDYLDLFKHPESWANARAHVNVFKFGPWILNHGYQDFVAAGAFRKLHDWGIAAAIEVPAVKEWDCTGTNTVKTTVELAKKIIAGGGAVGYLAMDEPIVSGLGMNESDCRLSPDQIADETAAYVRKVSAALASPAGGALPQFVDVEPYPSLRPPELENWLSLLAARGFRPAAFHLDIDMNRVAHTPGLDFAGDLRNLRDFLRAEGIPFGVILWSGHGPENSDAAYYSRTMEMTRAVQGALGRPDQVIFQSWILRAALSCPSGRSQCATQCGPNDPPTCGQHSIPVNLPDNDSSVYSHTRLILDGLSVLNGQAR